MAEKEIVTPIKTPDLRAIAVAADQWSAFVVNGPEMIARLNNDAAIGNTSGFIKAWVDSSEKNGEISSHVPTRKAAVLNCPVEIIAADDSAKAIEIAETVKTIWDDVPKRDEVIRSILDAVYQGFSLSQVMFTDQLTDGLWKIREIKTVPAESLIFSDTQGKILDYPKLNTVGGPANGIDLEPFRNQLIFHTRSTGGSFLRGGLARTLLWYALFGKFDLSQWLNFNERQANPMLIGKYPEGSSQDDVNKLFQAVRDFGRNARAAISVNTDITTLDVNQRAAVTSAYEKFQKFIRENITKIILGQTETSQSEGGSQAKATIQNLIREDRVEEDSKSLSETLNDQLIKPVVRLNYGQGETLFPKLQIICEKPADRELELKIITGAVDVGVPVGVTYAQEKLGIPEPEKGEATLQPSAGGGGQSPFSQAQARAMEDTWTVN